jgi:hypothetical protein
MRIYKSKSFSQGESLAFSNLTEAGWRKVEAMDGRVGKS